MSITLSTATAYEHVRLDDDGVPIIAGTTMKDLANRVEYLPL